MTYASHVSKKTTPQTEPAKTSQVKNNAGGYVFALDSWAMLDRFLILGAEGNTYYASEKKMTRDNAKNVEACLAEDGPRAVARIVEISKSGRAPKNEPAIFALALAAASNNPAAQKAAYSALGAVCRTGTHLFQFVEAVHALRGWGRALQRAVSAWYLSKPADALALQVLKYQAREGWSHRDVLRLAHPKPVHAGHAAIFEWIRASGETFEGVPGTKNRAVRRGKSPKARIAQYKGIEKRALPELLREYETMKKVETADMAAALIREQGFTREMIPTELLNSVKVWEALLFGTSDKATMPMTAMIRNLGKMSAVGLLKPLSSAGRAIADRLVDPLELRRAKIHPLQLFSALHTYAQGHGEKGKLTWTPDPRVVEALNDAFYLAFAEIEPTGKSWLLGLDVSGSMASGEIAGMAGLTPRVASAIMAMVTARVEKNYAVMAFGDRFHPLDITPSDRLDTVCAKVSGLPFGNTDCSLPMLWALEHDLEVDAFCVYTDNETYAGSIHPFQALKQYRSKTGRPHAKFIAQAFTATRFSIADESDPGSMNVVGLDAAAPALMSAFVRGDFDPPSETVGAKPPSRTV